MKGSDLTVQSLALHNQLIATQNHENELLNEIQALTRDIDMLRGLLRAHSYAVSALIETDPAMLPRWDEALSQGLARMHAEGGNHAETQ